MSSRRAFGSTFLAVSLLLAKLDAQSMSRPAVFQANSRLVLVPVTVTDNYGKTILGLRAQDFNILDDQTPQRILSFSNEDQPCSIGVVLDVSGSMRKALSIAQDGAQAFVRSSNQNDEFMLLTVSTQPEANSDFTTDAADIDRRVGFSRAGGMTALIDTVYSGLTKMKQARNPQRALLVFSDGMDNHSRYSKGQLLRTALEADVQIYTIILEGLSDSSSSGALFRPSMIAKPGDRGPQLQGPELLQSLADKTGGLHFHARNSAQVREAIAKVGDALRSQYIIGYQPAESLTSGKSHRIHVTTTVPKVYVHARTGYYAP